MTDINDTCLGVLAGCVLANFTYQALKDREWDVAFERSFFQVIVVLIILWQVAS